MLNQSRSGCPKTRLLVSAVHWVIPIWLASREVYMERMRDIPWALVVNYPNPGTFPSPGTDWDFATPKQKQGETDRLPGPEPETDRKRVESGEEPRAFPESKDTKHENTAEVKDERGVREGAQRSPRVCLSL